jgi:hypothetical protein
VDLWFPTSLLGSGGESSEMAGMVTGLTKMAISDSPNESGLTGTHWLVSPFWAKNPLVLGVFRGGLTGLTKKREKQQPYRDIKKTLSLELEREFFLKPYRSD